MELLLLGLFDLLGQIFVMGLLRPFHAIDGTVEATGGEAGFGLSFGFEWHVSGSEIEGD